MTRFSRARSYPTDTFLVSYRPASLAPSEGRNDFEYEPTKEEVLSTLLPLYVETQLYQVMLEATSRPRWSATSAAWQPGAPNSWPVPRRRLEVQDGPC